MTESQAYHFILIDDNEIDLLLHQKTIAMLLPNASVSCFVNGESAIQYLSTHSLTQPYIILLDINMPIMDGFQFMEQFAQLDQPILALSKTFLLSSSSNQYDISRAHNNSLISAMVTKPLSKEKLLHLLTF